MEVSTCGLLLQKVTRFQAYAEPKTDARSSVRITAMIQATKNRVCTITLGSVLKMWNSSTYQIVQAMDLSGHVGNPFCLGFRTLTVKKSSRQQQKMSDRRSSATLTICEAGTQSRTESPETSHVVSNDDIEATNLDGGRNGFSKKLPSSCNSSVAPATPPLSLTGSPAIRRGFLPPRSSGFPCPWSSFDSKNSAEFAGSPGSLWSSMLGELAVPTLVVMGRQSTQGGEVTVLLITHEMFDAALKETSAVGEKLRLESFGPDQLIINNGEPPLRRSPRPPPLQLFFSPAFNAESEVLNESFASLPSIGLNKNNIRRDDKNDESRSPTTDPKHQVDAEHHLNSLSRLRQPAATMASDAEASSKMAGDAPPANRPTDPITPGTPLRARLQHNNNSSSGKILYPEGTLLPKPRPRPVKRNSSTSSLLRKKRKALKGSMSKAETKETVTNGTLGGRRREITGKKSPLHAASVVGRSPPGGLLHRARKVTSTRDLLRVDDDFADEGLSTVSSEKSLESRQVSHVLLTEFNHAGDKQRKFYPHRTSKVHFGVERPTQEGQAFCGIRSQDPN